MLINVHMLQLHVHVHVHVSLLQAFIAKWRGLELYFLNSCSQAYKADKHTTIIYFYLEKMWSLFVYPKQHYVHCVQKEAYLDTFTLWTWTANCTKCYELVACLEHG